MPELSDHTELLAKAPHSSCTLCSPSRMILIGFAQLWTFLEYEFFSPSSILRDEYYKIWAALSTRGLIPGADFWNCIVWLPILYLRSILWLKTMQLAIAINYARSELLSQDRTPFKTCNYTVLSRLSSPEEVPSVDSCAVQASLHSQTVAYS